MDRRGGLARFFARLCDLCAFALKTAQFEITKFERQVVLRIPRWSRWLLGSVTLLAVVAAALLVPAVQEARNSAKKSSDK